LNASYPGRTWEKKRPVIRKYKEDKVRNHLPELEVFLTQKRIKYLLRIKFL